MKFTFNIDLKIKEAWALYKEHLKSFLLLVLVTFFVSSLSGNDNQNTLLVVLIYIVSILISYIWIRATIELIDKKTFRPFSREIFPSLLQFWNYFKTIFLSTVCIIVGFILFIIPGFYVTGRLIFSSYISVEKNQGARKTIREAWDSTREYGWNLFWKSLVIGFIIFAGLLALLVGIFITYPLGMILLVMLYREFAKVKHTENKEEVQIPEVSTVITPEENKEIVKEESK